MKLTADAQKKLAVIVGFAVLAGGILYYQLADTGTAPSRPVQTAPAVSSTPAAQGGAAKSVGNTAAQLDPTLKMGPMLVTERLVYSGTGRNIFSATSAPVAIPKALAPARPKSTAPVAMVPAGPPPPPPIDLQFFGTETNATGKRRAFLLHGDDVFLAQDGDIVQRRYRILTVLANSVQVEDLTNNNRQTLPLIMH